MISLSLWTFTLGAAVALACSAPDPGVNYQLTPGTGVSSSSGSSPGGSSGASTATGSSGGAGSSGGVTNSGSSSGSPIVSGSGSGANGGSSGGADGDAGAAEAGGGGGSFLGETTPWASNLPGTTALQAHQSGGQVTQTPTLDCGGCHTAGPGPAFLASGFVSSSASGTTGAADVEIRVQPSAGGTAYSAHSDANGYFWIPAPATVPAGPFNAGARNATATQIMPSPPTPGDCTSCHGADSPGMHLP